MKNRVQFGVLAAFVAVAFLGCGRGPTDPGDINIYNQNTNTNNNGQGSPTGTASPSTGSLPPGSYVSIGVFGRSCPSGITDVPAGTRQFRVGCVYDVTATPRGADQKELTIDVTGPIATWSEPNPPGLGAISVQENSYNITFRAGPGTGSVTLKATVKGTSGEGIYSVVQ